MRGLAAAGAVLLAMALAVPARSQSSDDCSGGSVYDDGTFENGYGARPSSGWSEYVMRFNPPAGTRKLERVCACFTRSGADSSLSFDLNVYALALDGRPGELLGTQRAFAIGVPQYPSRRFYSYDVSNLDIEGGYPVYIGPAWSPVEDTQIYLCADQNGPAVRPGYTNFTGRGHPLIQPITDSFPTYKALGLRALFDAPCEPREGTLCLNDNRFKVEVDWTHPNGSRGKGWAVPLPGREDSGLFWFFDAKNIELLIKVLDHCGPPFDSFWVFFAATTNVGFELTVTDTVSDERRVYSNPVGRSALPVQDTQAFKTCDADRGSAPQ
jgi:hypothetical protein